MNEFCKVPTNGNSATAEGAALALLQIIASVEGKEFTQSSTDRKWILETYGQCISTVRNGFFE